MAMVRQYPHFLFLETAPDSVQDENGDFQDVEAQRIFISMCREETDGKGSRTQVAGGDYTTAGALVQLPLTCPKIDNGAMVVIANDKDCLDVRIGGLVKNFSIGQLHSRLWL